jgi:hypothetical protein
LHVAYNKKLSTFSIYQLNLKEWHFYGTALPPILQTETAFYENSGNSKSFRAFLIKMLQFWLGSNLLFSVNRVLKWLCGRRGTLLWSVQGQLA